MRKRQPSLPLRPLWQCRTAYPSCPSAEHISRIWVAKAKAAIALGRRDLASEAARRARHWNDQAKLTAQAQAETAAKCLRLVIRRGYAAKVYVDILECGHFLSVRVKMPPSSVIGSRGFTKCQTVAMPELQSIVTMPRADLMAAHWDWWLTQRGYRPAPPVKVFED